MGHAGALRRLAGLTIGACLLSMAQLAAFWDTVLVIGIDLALLVIAVTRPARADRLIQ